MIIIFTAIPIIIVPSVTEEVYTVTEGDNITCTATGYPVPDVVWLNNDGSVVDEDKLNDSVMTTGIDNVFSVSVSLIIRRNDAGVYKCFANNSVGNDTSTIRITVECKYLLSREYACF